MVVAWMCYHSNVCMVMHSLKDMVVAWMCYHSNVCLAMLSMVNMSDGIYLSEIREDVDDVLSDNSTSNCYYIPPLLNKFGCNYFQKSF